MNGITLGRAVIEMVAAGTEKVVSDVTKTARDAQAAADAASQGRSVDANLGVTRNLTARDRADAPDVKGAIGSVAGVLAGGAVGAALVGIANGAAALVHSFDVLRAEMDRFAAEQMRGANAFGASATENTRPKGTDLSERIRALRTERAAAEQREAEDSTKAIQAIQEESVKDSLLRAKDLNESADESKARRIQEREKATADAVTDIRLKARAAENRLIIEAEKDLAEEIARINVTTMEGISAARAAEMERRKEQDRRIQNIGQNDPAASAIERAAEDARRKASDTLYERTKAHAEAAHRDAMENIAAEAREGLSRQEDQIRAARDARQRAIDLAVDPQHKANLQAENERRTRVESVTLERARARALNAAQQDVDRISTMRLEGEARVLGQEKAERLALEDEIATTADETAKAGLQARLEELKKAQAAQQGFRERDFNEAQALAKLSAQEELAITPEERRDIQAARRKLERIQLLREAGTDAERKAANDRVDIEEKADRRIYDNKRAMALQAQRDIVQSYRDSLTSGFGLGDHNFDGLGESVALAALTRALPAQARNGGR